MHENGIIHAMDILNHNRMHNLSEDTYNEIKSLIDDAFDDNSESDQIKIFKDDQKLKIVLMSKNDEEFANLFNDYHKLFDRIDNLIDNS